MDDLRRNGLQEQTKTEGERQDIEENGSQTCRQ